MEGQNAGRRGAPGGLRTTVCSPLQGACDVPKVFRRIDVAAHQRGSQGEKKQEVRISSRSSQNRAFRGDRPFETDAPWPGVDHKTSSGLRGGRTRRQRTLQLNDVSKPISTGGDRSTASARNMTAPVGVGRGARALSNEVLTVNIAHRHLA